MSKTPQSSPSLYRIEVVPLTPLYGRRDPRFSYASPIPILPGSLVAISFGQRNLTGVVLASDQLPIPVPAWMKFVGPVILPGFLTASQMNLAWHLSDTLYAPLGIVFKLFFPIQSTPRTTKGSADAIKRRLGPKSEQKLTPRKRTRTSLALTEGLSDDTALFKRLVMLAKKATTEKRPLLVLVPEILAAELYAAQLARELPQASIRCLSSRQTGKEQYLIATELKEHALDILVGTRQAVFAPLETLGAIAIIDPEKRLSFTQWEMAPRYDAVAIAELIARELRIPCFKLSVAPGIEYFSQGTHGSGTPFIFSAQRSLVTVDLRKTYRRGGASQVLTPDLSQAIRFSQARRESVLILVKQRGLARFSLCAKCQTPLRCPDCAAALTETKDTRYRCLSCGYRSALFPSCRECGHMHFKNFGAGIEAITRALAEQRLGDAVIVIDRDAQNLKRDFQSLIIQLNDPKPEPLIIVATYASAYSLPLPSLGLIGMIEPDQGLFYPDFQSEERLWQQLRRFGGKLAARGQLLVQTFEPESRYWTTWAKQDLSQTAKPLLEERRMLRYPPDYRLIQLECFPTKAASSLVIAEKTESALRALALPTLEIIPRYLPFNRKNRYHVLVRYPAKETFPEALHRFLGSLDHSVHITVDPLSLLG